MMKRDMEKRVILRIDQEDRKNEISCQWIDDDLIVCVIGIGSQIYLEYRGDCFDLDLSFVISVVFIFRLSRL